MKEMKKIWIMLLRVFSLCSAICFAAGNHVVRAEESEGHTYQKLENGTVEITGYKGSGGEVIIPGEIDGMAVTGIGDSAFEGCSSLKSITIPDGVTSIGDDAFRDCSSLENITVPDGVIYIGEWAFYDCSNLESITIPHSVYEHRRHSIFLVQQSEEHYNPR